MICSADYDKLISYHKFDNEDELALNELSECDEYSYTGIGGTLMLLDPNTAMIELVEGCTDAQADNYDPNAECDDGSCYVSGCTHPNADNYNPLATQDDGSCWSCLEGVCFEGVEFLPESEIMNAEDQLWLMQQLGEEFHFEAELIHDEETHTQGIDIQNIYETPHTLMIIENSCGQVFGGYNVGYWREAPDGIDFNSPSYQCNFLFRLSDETILNTLETFTTGTTLSEPYYVFPEGTFYDFGFNYDLYINFVGPVVGEEIYSSLGTTYECPLNDQTGVQSNPTDECDFYFQEDCPENIVSKVEFYALKTTGRIPGSAVQYVDTDGDGVCDSEGEPGCNDASACNYNSEDSNATACQYPDGCTDAGAVNFIPTAQCDDGSCLYAGCTNVSASNYDSTATLDDGSCVIFGCTNHLAENYTPQASIEDGSCLYAGCTDVSASNYDSTATLDDGSCVIFGCTNHLAENYNPEANVEDGSCISGEEGLCFELTEFLPESEIMSISDQYWLMNQLDEEFHFEAELLHDEEQISQIVNYSNIFEIPNTLMIIENSCGQVFGGFNAGYWRYAPDGVDFLDADYESNFLFRLSDFSILNTRDTTDLPFMAYEPYFVFQEGSFYDVGFNFDLYVNFNYVDIVGELILSNLGTYYECPSNVQCDSYFQEDCPENRLAKIEFYALKTSGLMLGGSDSFVDTDGDGECDSEGIPGCNDPNACNFNILDSNTILCNYNSGCLDPSAINYTALAQCDDGSCVYAGCTNPDADNYNSMATLEDFTCIFSGCTDELACNYDEQANLEDDSCIYTSELADAGEDQYICNNPFSSQNLFTVVGNLPDGFTGGWTIVSGDINTLGSSLNAASQTLGIAPETSAVLRWSISDGNCISSDEVTIVNNLTPQAYAGTSQLDCTETFIMNADEPAVGTGEWSTESGIIIADITDRNTEVSNVPLNFTQYLTWTVTNGHCTASDDTQILRVGGGGCTDPTAGNYDPSATCDDGSCIPGIGGCNDESACNYDSNATANDGTCTYPDGCTDTTAVNYSALASCDDGSCIYAGCTNPEDVNYNSMATLDDGSCESYGENFCPGDFTGDGNVNVADLGGFLGAFGESCN